MRPMNGQGLQVLSKSGGRDGVHILTLQGTLSVLSAPSLHEAVNACSGRALVIDMTGVSHIDSMAVGGLVRAYVSCQKSGRKLALVGLNRRVLNILSITGVEPLFEMYASAAEAENALA
ncbi:MAG TPA: STAS domain-containing protein [Candidatus Acidoferrum sp.]|nr:STAS domain-containing protein [Candidatus Acidoferrum sp.]